MAAFALVDPQYLAGRGQGRGQGRGPIERVNWHEWAVGGGLSTSRMEIHGSARHGEAGARCQMPVDAGLAAGSWGRTLLASVLRRPSRDEGAILLSRAR